VTWGGAQWTMFLLLAFGLIVPLAVRVSDINDKPPTEWLGFYLGRIAESLVLTTILAWGGFWG
jgi:hypothetical protein